MRLLIKICRSKILDHVYITSFKVEFVKEAIENKEFIHFFYQFVFFILQ